MRTKTLIWRGTLLLATTIGIATALLSRGPFHPATVKALLESLGWAGCLAYASYSLLIFVPLGFAWLLVTGEHRRWLPAFIWARMLREAASDLLPFSQIGGIVIGADSLIEKGMSGISVYAAMTVDLTTEMASQVLFTLVGVALFASGWMTTADIQLQFAIVASLCAIVLLATAARFVPGRIPAIAPKFLGRLIPDALPIVRDVADEVERIYARRARIVGSTVINFFAWTSSATGAWIVLHWIGVSFPFHRVLALEAFIFALRSVAFMVPGGLGVQEAGYILAAPLFGLPVESALALAIAKRCKDLALSVPTLIIWQVSETRNFTASLRRMKSRAMRMTTR